MQQKIDILIVEDEPLAAAQLASIIGQVESEAHIVAICDTVESTIEWLNSNPKPDLAFFDIQLGDGFSFEAIEACPNITFPIIFATAFDQYTLQAFKTNSIDYILKPLNKDDVKQAFVKFRNLYGQQKVSFKTLKQIMNSSGQKHYKKRFVAKVGTHLRQIESEDILYFYSELKATYAQLNNGKTYLMDYPLDRLEVLLDPASFFRINRKYIVANSSIEDMCFFSSSKLKIKIQDCNDHDVFVARDRLKPFKAWLEGEICG